MILLFYYQHFNLFINNKLINLHTRNPYYFSEIKSKQNLVHLSYGDAAKQ